MFLEAMIWGRRWWPSTVGPSQSGGKCGPVRASRAGPSSSESGRSVPVREGVRAGLSSEGETVFVRVLCRPGVHANRNLGLYWFLEGAGRRWVVSGGRLGLERRARILMRRDGESGRHGLPGPWIGASRERDDGGVISGARLSPGRRSGIRVQAPLGRNGCVRVGQVARGRTWLWGRDRGRPSRAGP